MRTFLIFLVISITSSLTLAQIKIPIKRELSKFVSTANHETDQVIINHPNTLRPTTLQLYSRISQNLSNYDNFQYYGYVNIGSENAPFKVLIDTGSDTFWLSSSNCTGCPKEIRAFNCSASNTCVRSTTFKKKTYSVGYVDGVMIQDYIGLTPEIRVNYNFLLVQNASKIENMESDGLMGLSPLNNISDFIDYLYDSKYIKDKIFSFVMDDCNDSEKGKKTTNNSLLVIGEIPEEHVNKLVWMPIIRGGRHWVTEVFQTKIGNKIIDITKMNNAQKVMFDTGTSVLSLSTIVYQELVASVNSSGACATIQDTIYCLCDSDEELDSYPNITFALPGAIFNITSRQYLINPKPIFQESDENFCFLSAIERKNNSDNQVLGDPYFRGTFTVFSKINQTVGINVEGMTYLKPIKKDIGSWSGITAVVLLLLTLLWAIYRMRNFDSGKWEGNELAYQNQYVRLKGSFATAGGAL